MSVEEDIGYIKAALEGGAGRMKRVEEQIKENNKIATEEMHKVHDRLDSIEAQLSLYKTAIMIAKSIGWVIVLIATLKFGDIPNKLNALWHGQ